MRSQIETEWDFWREIKIDFANCTFNGLISAGLMPHNYLIYMDVKNEIPLLNRLLSKYRIKTADAMYAMVAHSAEMQFFLTWDKKLIRRLKRVPWFKPQAMTPADFLTYSNDTDAEGN